MELTAHRSCRCRAPAHQTPRRPQRGVCGQCARARFQQVWAVAVLPRRSRTYSAFELPLAPSGVYCGCATRASAVRGLFRCGCGSAGDSRQRFEHSVYVGWPITLTATRQRICTPHKTVSQLAPYAAELPHRCTQLVLVCQL